MVQNKLFLYTQYKIQLTIQGISSGILIMSNKIIQNAQQIQVKQVQSSELPKYLQQKLPVHIIIGSDSFTTIPQYPDTEMKWLQVLLRNISPLIPDDEKIIAVNWTQGSKIGKHIEPHQTISSLVEGSKAVYPTIRLYWENAQPFKIKVDLHDILELTYNNATIFDYVDDLLLAIKKDIKANFRLNKDAKFKLKIAGDMKKATKLSFLGRYFDPSKVNHILVMISFQEDLTTQFVRNHNKGKYQHLVCPISQLIMQDPVTTSCNHKFDRLCISLAIMKDNKCPVCRSHLKLKEIKPARYLKSELKRLKNEYDEEERQQFKVKKEEEIGENI